MRKTVSVILVAALMLLALAACTDDGKPAATESSGATGEPTGSTAPGNSETDPSESVTEPGGTINLPDIPW